MTAAFYAALNDIPIKSYRIDMKGYANFGGFYGVSDKFPVGFDRVVTDVSIETDAPEEQVKQFQEMVLAAVRRARDDDAAGRHGVALEDQRQVCWGTGWVGSRLAWPGKLTTCSGAPGRAADDLSTTSAYRPSNKGVGSIRPSPIEGSWSARRKEPKPLTTDAALLRPRAS